MTLERRTMWRCLCGETTMGGLESCYCPTCQSQLLIQGDRITVIVGEWTKVTVERDVGPWRESEDSPSSFAA